MEKPLCENCFQYGIIRAATECHHVPPHNGSWWHFINNPLTSLCKPCHNARRYNASGPTKPPRVIGPDGWPV